MSTLLRQRVSASPLSLYIATHRSLLPSDWVWLTSQNSHSVSQTCWHFGNLVCFAICGLVVRASKWMLWRHHHHHHHHHYHHPHHQHQGFFYLILEMDTVTPSSEKWVTIPLVPTQKALRETQTLRAGCSRAELKIFAPPQTPFPGAQNGQNLISWRWSLPLPTNPVWWSNFELSW